MRGLLLSSLLLISMVAFSAEDNNHFTPGGLPLTQQLTDFPVPAKRLESAIDVKHWLQSNKKAFGFSAQSDINVVANTSPRNGYTVYRMQQTQNDIAVFAHQSVLVLENGMPLSAHLVSSSLPAQTPVSSKKLEQSVKQGLAAAQIEYQGDLAIVPVYWRSKQQLISAAQVDGNFSKQQKTFAYRLIITAAGELVKTIALQHDFSYQLIDVDQMCNRLSYHQATTPEDLLEMAYGYSGTYTLPKSQTQATTPAEKKLAVLFDSANQFMAETIGHAGIDSDNKVNVAAFVGDNYYQHSLSCYGNNESNAFFSRSQIKFFLGIMHIHSPFLRNPEVIMHELGHGIVSFSSGLIYEDQSGALNEAYADAVGVSFSAWRNKRMDFPTDEDWLMRAGSRVLRDFSYPTNVEQMPDHYSERYTGTKDHGGVHINSSIINHAFYLLAEGGEHRRLGGGTVPTLGMLKTLKIWHYGTTNILTPTSDFRDARYAFAEAAEIIYGKYSEERTAVHQAFDAVGVKGSWSVNVPPKPAPDPLPQPEQSPNPQPQPQPQPSPVPVPPLPLPKSDAGEDHSLLIILSMALALFFALFVIVRRSRPARQTIPAYQPYQYAAKPEVPKSAVVTPQPVKETSDIPFAYFHAAQKVYPLLSEVLSGQGVTVGRSTEAMISLSHSSVSSFHLRLLLQGNTLYVEDIGSSYGTRVGGVELSKHKRVKLALDQSLQLADLSCRISASSSSARVDDEPQQVYSVLVLRTTLQDVTLRSEEVGWQGISIGRDSGNDVVFAHSSLTKIHGRIRYANQRWLYQDLDSKYGSGLMQAGALQKLAPGKDVELTQGTELFLADFKIIITIGSTV